MSDSYYWCTTADRGQTATLDTGGYYEKINDSGYAIVSTAGHGGHVGFQTSNTPEVCMSESPAACLFALAHNTDTATELHIYQTEKEPDIRVSGGYDFPLLEEVRYRDPEDDPVRVEKYTTVTLPQRAFDDASETYNPHGPRNDPPDEHRQPLDNSPAVCRWWGRAVKDALATVLDGGDYPDPLDVDPPELPYANSDS